MAAREPVISVGTKKKELAGNFKNGGHDLAQNTGWVSLGVDNDTGPSK